MCFSIGVLLGGFFFFLGETITDNNWNVSMAVIVKKGSFPTEGL